MTVAQRTTQEYAGRCFRHVRTGGLYEVVAVATLRGRTSYLPLATVYDHVATAKLEATGAEINVFRHAATGEHWLVPCSPAGAPRTRMVLYRAIEGGQHWVRPEAQFFDGRFVEESRT